MYINLNFVVGKDSKSHVVDRETQRTTLKTESTYLPMASYNGPRLILPSGRAVDYKGRQELKSCF